MKNIIQIAGVIDKEEAELMINCGINFLGFPLRLPINKEDLSEDCAVEIISGFPKNINGVLITYLESAAELKSLIAKLGVNFLQIHGKISIEELSKLKSDCPNLKIIKSLIVRDDNLDGLKEDLRIFTEYVDYFITDTFDPTTGATGATGKTHDWKISRELVKISAKPIIAAGGLNAGNVYEAIKFIKPFGVDAHTGVENKSGRKSEDKVKLFVAESMRAFNEIKINK